jgi:hypothetical protein
LAVAHSYPAAELLASGADDVAPHIRDVTAEIIDALYRRLSVERP